MVVMTKAKMVNGVSGVTNDCCGVVSGDVGAIHCAKIMVYIE